MLVTGALCALGFLALMTARECARVRSDHVGRPRSGSPPLGIPLRVEVSLGVLGAAVLLPRLWTLLT
jgi:hypothetical protein